MDNAAATKVLKKQGKSFYFAKLFLAKDTGNAAARLYQFCRLIDDIADENPDICQARHQLEVIQQSLVANESDHPVVNDFLMLCTTYGIDRQHGITLISGVMQDLEPVALLTYDELLNYAYRVAGVVGLMMAPILGAERSGYCFAIDLGIAMQFTNIARDVFEDAQMNRRYLPADWVNNLDAQALLSPNTTQQAVVKNAIARLLHTAETFYDSGISGLYFLYPKNKKAIAVAAYLYRGIGRKLLAQHPDYRQGRVMVGFSQKCVLALQALVDLKAGNIARDLPQHQPRLHDMLNTPCIDSARSHVQPA